MLEPSGVRVLIDHCGRPDPAAGLDQPGFATLLELASTGRYFVKISGLVKCSAQRYPWADSWPYVQALLEAFTPDRCMWGSDWPFLRAPERIDYGTILALTEKLDPGPGRPPKGVVGHARPGCSGSSSGARGQIQDDAGRRRSSEVVSCAPSAAIRRLRGRVPSGTSARYGNRWRGAGVGQTGSGHQAPRGQVEDRAAGQGVQLDARTSSAAGCRSRCRRWSARRIRRRRSPLPGP